MSLSQTAEACFNTILWFPLIVLRSWECFQQIDHRGRTFPIFEIKWDGLGTIAEVEGSAARLYPRNQQFFNKPFPEIVRSLEKLRHEVVMDGEILALNERGKSRTVPARERSGARPGFLT